MKAAWIIGALLFTACAAPATAPRATDARVVSSAPPIVAVSTTAPPMATAAATPTLAIATPAAPGTCRIRGPLPDPVCTPGLADPRVTQENIATTICVSGYTKTVRPAATYTNGLKIDQMKAYGMTDLTPGDVEEDHLIALAIGGHPRDPRNLWPQPRATVPGASQKDALENRLHADVCGGRITLAEAQRAMATDWVAAAGLRGVTATPAPTALATPAPTVAPTDAATTPPATSTLTVTITASRYGLVSAATLAGASCTAKARLPSGSYSSAQGLTVAVTADEGGAVSWGYRTSTSTKVGTGTHSVFCTLAGQSATASAPFSVP